MYERINTDKGFHETRIKLMKAIKRLKTIAVFK